jgi:hypothetical protein
VGIPLYFLDRILQPANFIYKYEVALITVLISYMPSIYEGCVCTLVENAVPYTSLMKDTQRTKLYACTCTEILKWHCLVRLVKIYVSNSYLH